LAAIEGQPDLLRKLHEAYANAVKTNQVGKDATKDALLYNILGMLSVRVGDMSKAVEAYKKAVALQPNEADSVRNYTLVLSDTRQYGEAFSQTQHLINMISKEKGKEQEAAAFSWLAEYFKSQMASGGQ
jgi:tetratricopeptide (TPR) repeat protein